MSALDPSGPAQPPNAAAYSESANPTTRNPKENASARHEREYNPIESRNPPRMGENAQQEGMATSLGRGVRGDGPVDAQETRGSYREDDRQKLQNENEDAEQMATYAEGDVAHAVERKSGTQMAPGQGPVEFDDFASDLDRKKAEQAEARKAIQEQRKAGMDVDGGQPSRESRAEV